MKNEILDIAKKLYHNHLTPETATNLLLDLFDVSGSALDRQEILKIATELTNRVPDKIHRSDGNDMEHIKANLKAAIILQLRKMHYR